MVQTASKLWPLPLEELVQMREQGLSFREIARRCGVSHNTVRKAMQGLYQRREMKAPYVMPDCCPVCGAKLETGRAAANRLRVDAVGLLKQLHRLAEASLLSCVSRIGHYFIAPPAVWNLLAQVDRRKRVDHAEIIEHYLAVGNQEQVARDLGVSVTTVRKVLLGAGITSRRCERWAIYQGVAQRALQQLKLTERQATVLQECLRQKSLTAVGARLGITKERVRQVLQQVAIRLMDADGLECDSDAWEA